MRKFHVKLLLESPLIVGGHRLVNNVFYSLDYITGSVLRAAFVRQILLNCPIFDENKDDGYKKDNKTVKYNYVYIRDEEYCRNCDSYKLCKDFSSIKFSFFYPEGTEIIPLTSKKCKEFDDHCFIDSIAGTAGTKSKQCKANNCQDPERRLEYKKGYRKGGTFFSLYNKRSNYTKTAIDPYTRRAKDNYLYSINAIDEGVMFEGSISLPESLNFEDILVFCDRTGGEENKPVVYVGKRSSSGFGKVSINNFFEMRKKEDNLKKSLEEFNIRILKNKFHDVNPSKTYIPILFTSDAKLEIGTFLDLGSPKTNKEYLEMWNKLIFGSSESIFSVEEVYAEHDYYKGFDTSLKPEELEKNKRAQTQILTLKGTSLLLSSEKEIDEIVDALRELQNKGVGKETDNGFGEIEVCNILHVKGEVVNG
jgi:hypothetical protein